MISDLSKLNLVRLGKPMPRGALVTLASRIQEAFSEVVRYIEIVDYDKPPVDQIEAQLLTQALGPTFAGLLRGFQIVLRRR